MKPEKIVQMAVHEGNDFSLGELFVLTEAGELFVRTVGNDYSVDSWQEIRLPAEMEEIKEISRSEVAWSSMSERRDK